MTAEYLLWGMICGYVGARAENWAWAPRGGGLLGSLLVSQIAIHSPLRIRSLILIGALLAIAAELLYRNRHYRIRRCAWCERIVWPWQNWCRMNPDRLYHNMVKRNCAALGALYRWPR